MALREKMKRAVEQPDLVFQPLNRLYYNVTNETEFNDRGIDVLQEDWDNLIILDACRYDFFEEHCTLDGNLEKRISKAAATEEFLRATFGNRTIRDLVYVSSNPQYERLKTEIDAEVFKYIATEKDALDGLSVYPETVTDDALDAAEDHPDKRLMVHYMQPHQPYLAGGGEEIDYGMGLVATMKKNDLTQAEVREAYRANLDYVLEEVTRLIDSLEGKTVITADHGEILGERQRPFPARTFSHPTGIYIKETVEVPWFIVDRGERKDIVPEAPVRDEVEESVEEVDSHLRDLGYLD
ncbi:sulfatase-like hydrolase/transferase [Halorarum salinum]|uniref:Sulfatase N-terminal domain-containing protein n=1 Tax=Halorarum salinum TaxID=2743089 RepID=A0A7D5QCV0_9EURY|nr:sulfatase-like hydrolase/transferase [Halobaculum salinum]QLG62840.1 hypothetical protein HUG12_14325 [Halobaculum salinum]